MQLAIEATDDHDAAADDGRRSQRFTCRIAPSLGRGIEHVECCRPATRSRCRHRPKPVSKMSPLALKTSP